MTATGHDLWVTLLRERDSKLSLNEWTRILPDEYEEVCRGWLSPVLGEVAQEVRWSDGPPRQVTDNGDGTYSISSPESGAQPSLPSRIISVGDIQLHRLNWHTISKLVLNNLSLVSSGPEEIAPFFWRLGHFVSCGKECVYYLCNARRSDELELSTKRFQAQHNYVFFPHNVPAVLGRLVDINLTPLLLTDFPQVRLVPQSYPFHVVFNGKPFIAELPARCEPHYPEGFDPREAFGTDDPGIPDSEFSDSCDMRIIGLEKTLILKLQLEHPWRHLPVEIKSRPGDSRNPNCHLGVATFPGYPAHSVCLWIHETRERDRAAILAARTLTASASSVDLPVLVGPSNPEYAIIHYGQTIEVYFEGVRILVPSGMGIKHVKFLIKHAGEAFHASTLYGKVANLAGVIEERSHGIDARFTKRQYADLIKTRELAISGMDQDSDEYRDAVVELREIRAGVAAARDAKDGATKAYDNIRTALQDLYGSLEKSDKHPDSPYTAQRFSAHLRQRIKTGRNGAGAAQHFMYEPDPEVEWVLS